MDKLIFNTKKTYSQFKILHAVNNGPVHKRFTNDQLLSNFEAYKKLQIPYARNHDAAFHSTYGGEFTVDISAIFPDFNADVNSPDSYDFACTDEYVGVTLDAGTETFYRLGQKIEHEIKKHHTLPPKDFNKWAQICEHIIMHFNEGWNNGFHYNIKYWEIWNEPDLDPDDSTNKRTWGGTKPQFFDLYEITAKRLKSRFPDLKIGGPALAFNISWAEDFLSEMKKRNVPIDFFSWHFYGKTPQKMIDLSEKVKNLLNKYGYSNAESILNEWNYIRGWVEDFVYSLLAIKGIKGASFTLAAMCEAQPSSIDMLMYYDARPTGFNGLFDSLTLEPLKGYYPFLWYSKLYDGYKEIRAENKIEDIYSLCGINENGKRIMLVTHYSENDDTPAKNVEFDLGGGTFNVYLLDSENENKLIKTTNELQFNMKVFDCLLIEEV